MKETITFMKNRNTIFTTTLLALGSFVLSPIAQGVTPAPDGGYPGFNTAEGQNALFSRTTGVWNTGVGGFSLYSDTTGNGNTAVGVNAMRLNGTGEFNTALGANALHFNNGNPPEGSYNSAFGSFALFQNSTGTWNTALGFNALQSNTTGDSNTAIGAYALRTSTGSLNTAVGTSALANNQGGMLNTATGVNALGTNNSGNDNTAMGHHALRSNDVGGSNTAIGVDALKGNTSGGANTALGHGAGANVTTGSYNVYIGTNVGGVPDEVGHTYISNIASTQQNLSPVTVDLATGLLGHEFSSQRYKEEIKPMGNASEALFALKPVTYRYKKEIDASRSRDYGLVAEEVAKINPNLAVRDGKGRIESIRYNAINAMLLNEFLKAHRKMEKQQKQIDALTAQLNQQAALIQKVSAQVEMNKSTTKVAISNP
jgi:trimeric autotransporter adhesin